MHNTNLFNYILSFWANFFFQRQINLWVFCVGAWHALFPVWLGPPLHQLSAWLPRTKTMYQLFLPNPGFKGKGQCWAERNIVPYPTHFYYTYKIYPSFLKEIHQWEHIISMKNLKETFVKSHLCRRKGNYKMQSYNGTVSTVQDEVCTWSKLKIMRCM